MIGMILVGCNTESDNAQEGPENGDDGTNKELNIAMESQPSTLDPIMTTSTPTRDVSRNIFESLVALDSSYNEQPVLAKSFDKSEDGKTITFELRDDVVFHNGDEMTADDVVASMERWLNESSDGKPILGDDAVLEKEDDNTVVLTLSEPVNETLSVMANASNAPIMPKEIAESAASEQISNEDIIGTGPFQFEEWKTDQYIHLKKFADYQPVDAEADGLAGKKEALVDDIYFHIVPDISTREAGIQTGEYDIARSLNYDSYDQIESNPDLQTNLEMFGNLVFVFNTKDGLFEDRKARQAINAALVTEEIMHAGFSNDNYYTLFSGYMNEKIEGFYTESGEDGFNQNDQEKARRLLDEVGYDGEELTILTYRDDEYHYKSAVALQDQLRDIDVDLDVEVVDQATYSELREDPENWDMITAGFSIKTSPTQLLSLDPN